MTTKTGRFSAQGRATPTPTKGKRNIEPERASGKGGYSAPLARGGVTGFSGGSLTRAVRPGRIKTYDGR